MWTACLALGGVVFASDGLAAPAPLFGRTGMVVPEPSAAELEARAADLQHLLRERGWVQHGDEIRPGDASGMFATEPQHQLVEARESHRATIFLNFFGGELSPGTNATLDQSSCLRSPVDWPRYTGTEQEALAIIEIFERNVEPFGIRIAYEDRPPNHLPYAMVMLGGRPGLLGLQRTVLGVSCSSDCGDRWWRDTTFAFTANSSNVDALGTTALHEAAHAFGLAHIDDDSRIMNPFVFGNNPSWASECTALDASTSGINCASTHDDFCDTGQQNSRAELMAFFGPNSPDIEPPEVHIVSPEDRTQIEVGEDITIEADITDDHPGFGWKLVVPELDQEAVAFDFEKTWTLSGLPEGVYTLRVEAIDHDLNEGEDEVLLIVGDPDPSEFPDDGDDDAAQDEDSGGCRTTGNGSDSTSAWLLLLGLGLWGQRRSREQVGLAVRPHQQRRR